MINYIKQYFKPLLINSNQLESNINVNIIMKSSCQGCINMVKWKGVDKSKRRCKDDIYRNYIFYDRNINMP